MEASPSPIPLLARPTISNAPPLNPIGEPSVHLPRPERLVSALVSCAQPWRSSCCNGRRRQLADSAEERCSRSDSLLSCPAHPRFALIALESSCCWRVVDGYNSTLAGAFNATRSQPIRRPPPIRLSASSLSAAAPPFHPSVQPPFAMTFPVICSSVARRNSGSQRHCCC